MRLAIGVGHKAEQCVASGLERLGEDDIRLLTGILRPDIRYIFNSLWFHFRLNRLL